MLESYTPANDTLAPIGLGSQFRQPPEKSDEGESVRTGMRFRDMPMRS
jgi:hypothetical protein